MPRYDENDPESYDRPRRHTRPRTKERPAYEDAIDAVVVTVDRGRITCRLLVDHPENGVDGMVMAMKSRPLGRKGVVVGDVVGLVGDVSGEEGSLARIVTIADRSSMLRRTADDDDPVERVIVANADQLLIVIALADPEPRPRLIDRALVAAYVAKMTPILVLTKSDLADPAELLAAYEPLGVEVIVTHREDDQASFDRIRARLDGHRSVLLGHSGVGKSTLVNALIPEAHRLTGGVNQVTGRGRHTSTSAVMLAVSDGWVVDTPGIRSFGLAHVDVDDLLDAFGDLHELAEACPRGCTHAEGEPECGLDAADDAQRPRVVSFRRLLASRSGL